MQEVVWLGRVEPPLKSALRSGPTGAMLTAALLVALRPRPGALVSVGAGVLLAGWIGVQVAVIGFVSWLQPTLVAAALVMMVLSVMSLHRRSTER